MPSPQDLVQLPKLKTVGLVRTVDLAETVVVADESVAVIGGPLRSPFHVETAGLVFGVGFCGWRVVSGEPEPHGTGSKQTAEEITVVIVRASACLPAQPRAFAQATGAQSVVLAHLMKGSDSLVDRPTPRQSVCLQTTVPATIAN
jgi:hypothetical protein